MTAPSDNVKVLAKPTAVPDRRLDQAKKPFVRRTSSYNQNTIQPAQPLPEKKLPFGWVEVENEQMGTPPYERAGHTSVITGDQNLIIYGGHDADNNRLGDLTKYDLKKNMFLNVVAINRFTRLHKDKLELINNYNNKVPISPQQEISPPPPPRAYHTAVLKDDFMIVFGGCPSEKDGPVYFLHIESTTWLKFVSANNPPEVKLPRLHHTACMNGENMIVYGGVSGVTPLSSLLSFNTSKFKWTLISKDLPAIFKHSAFIKDDVLYVVGGTTDNGNNNFMGIDIKNGTVINRSNMFPASINLNLRLLTTIYDKKRDWLYIFGGFNVEEDDIECGCTDRLYIIDMKTKNYGVINSILMRCPSPRCGHTMNLYDDKLVVFGGCDRLPLLNGEWVFCDFSNTINIFNPPPPDIELSRLREIIQLSS